MTIRFYCPSGHRLSVEESHAGKAVRCAVCKETVIVPAPPERDAVAAAELPVLLPVVPPVVAIDPPEPPPIAPLDLPAVLPAPPAVPAKPAPPPMAVARVPVEPSRESTAPPVVPLEALPAADVPPAAKTPSPRVLRARVVADAPAAAPIVESKPEMPAPKPPVRRLPAAAEMPPRASSSDVAALIPPVVPLAAQPVWAESPWSDPVVPVPVPLPEALPAIEPLEPLEPRRRSKRAAVIAAASAGEGPDDAALVVEVPGRHRRRVAKGPKLVPPDVYLPDQRHVTQVKWLAAMLATAVLFSLLPLLTKMHLNPATAPGWARVALLLAVLQAVYVAWMSAAPDWASVWVVMLVFALAAAIYGAATAVAIATPAGKPLLLGLDAVRIGARSWCGAVLAMMTLATYLCGRTSARWRRDYQRELAARSA